MNVRVIPRLDIKGPNLVKGVHLEGLRVIGKPEYYAQRYYRDGADELLYIDIVASLYQRNSLHQVVERTAKSIFIPLTVGGGLRTKEDIRTILRVGADKVAINTAAIENPKLIREAARSFGSSTVVVSMEVIRKPDGTYECYTDNGRNPTGIDPFEWALRSVKLGAGELLVTSINQEGTGKGFDLELYRRIAASVNVPVIACGGAGTPEHVYQLCGDSNVDAVSVASLLHYHYIKEYERDPKQFDQGNIDFFMSGESIRTINAISLRKLKTELFNRGFEGREIETDL